MTDFSPREIVSELDRHIVGQRDASDLRLSFISEELAADLFAPDNVKSINDVVKA